MSNEKCQQCGAEFSRYVPDIFITLFGCGAGVYDDGHKSHSFRCYERQIEAQAAENERLIASNATMAGMVLKAIQDEREACAGIADQLGKFGYDGHKIAEAIRARGEVK